MGAAGRAAVAADFDSFTEARRLVTLFASVAPGGVGPERLPVRPAPASVSGRGTGRPGLDG